MAFKMKGSPAKLGEIAGTAGHASALKQWWNPFNYELKDKRVDEKSYHDDNVSKETQQKVYHNWLTGNRKVVKTDTTKSGGPGDFGGSQTDTKKTTTKLKKYGKKDQEGYDTREWIADKQTVKNISEVEGSAVGDYKSKDKTTTTDYQKMEPITHGSKSHQQIMDEAKDK